LCVGWTEEGQINLETPYIKEDISGESRDAYAVSCSSIPKTRIESWWKRQKKKIGVQPHTHTALTHGETMVQHLRFTRGDVKAKLE
jgi:hypothetical protein